MSTFAPEQAAQRAAGRLRVKTRGRDITDVTVVRTAEQIRAHHAYDAGRYVIKKGPPA